MKRGIKSKSDMFLIPLAYVLLAAGGLIMLYPFIFSFMGSLLTKSEYLKISILPRPGSLAISRFENLIKFFKGKNVWSSIGMTMLRTVFYAFVNIFFGVLGGYIFAKINFRGRKAVFFYFLMSMMMPGVVTLLPSYVMFVRWPLFGGNDILGQGGSGMIGHWAILFFPGWFGAYHFFLVRQSIYDIGSEIGESAEIDGAGKLRTIFTIYFPLLRPVVAVMLIGLIIGQWNDYLFPMTFMRATDYPQIIPIGYTVFKIIAEAKGPTNSIPDYPAIFGICFTAMLPPIIVFLCLQKQFITGLTMGSVKG